MTRTTHHDNETLAGWAEALPRATLPPRMSLLSVSAREPSWVNLTLQLDAHGCVEPRYQWRASIQEALPLLRDESFDCILIGGLHAEGDRELPTPAARETTDELLQTVRALRAAGCDDPVVLLTTHPDDRLWLFGSELGCEFFISPNLWDSLALGEVVRRAVAHGELLREAQRLRLADHRRLARERQESEQLLRQQRQIIAELESTLAAEGISAGGESAATAPSETEPATSQAAQASRLPDDFHDFYQELLRTHVIMGTGRLGSEIAELAHVLAMADFAPADVLDLHLQRLEALVRGLGRRSSRHVMHRADVLALELMTRLAECYRHRAAQKTAEADGA